MSIEKFVLNDEVPLFGVRVTTFPLGIGDAFTT